MSLYDFNQKNLFRIREDYMYSSFHGEKFLKSYFKNRKFFLNKINKFQKNNLFKEMNLNIEYLSKYLYQNKKLQINFRDTLKEKGILVDCEELYELGEFTNKVKIDTNKLIDQLLLNLVNNKKIRLSQNYIFKILMRFEVSKCLHNSYINKSNKFLKSNNSDKILKVYYYKFSMILALHFIKNSDLRILNTFLKINDLITSSHFYKSAIINQILYFNLVAETFFIKNLIVKNENK